MYYRGQRLTPTPANPIAYEPRDFALFEELGSDGRLAITVVQRRTKIEPAHWWAASVDSGQCQRHRLVLYRNRISVSKVLAILHELAPLISWRQSAESTESTNPYRFEGFLHGRVELLELDPDWLKDIDTGELKSQLYEIVQVVLLSLCQP